MIGSSGEVTLNGSGRKLLDFCVGNGLIITNTIFQHRDIHKFTWHRVSDSRTGTVCQQSLIDYVIVSEDLWGLVTDTRVWRGAELSTDHQLVVSRLRISDTAESHS